MQSQWSNSKLNIINSSKYKNLFTSHLRELCTEIQTKDAQTANEKGNFVILNIETEALDHIEKLLLDLFNSILLASIDFLSSTTPESLLSASMLNDASVSSSIILSNPILNMQEADERIRRVLPRNYAEEVCAKTKNMLDSFKATSKAHESIKTKLLKFPLLSSANSNVDLTQMLKLPTDHIHDILSKEIFNCKLDFIVTVYLVAILEHIASDILHLSSIYVRRLNKYIITERDLCTAIYADPMLAKLFYSYSTNGLPRLFLNYAESNENDEDDDDDDDNLTQFSGELASASSEQELNRKLTANSSLNSITSSFDNLSFGKQATLDANMRTTKTLLLNSTSTINTIVGSAISITNLSVNTDEGNSDSSTLCAESVSYEHLNLKYYLKLKEFLVEQNQHLYDLNVLRRIFMYLFHKSISRNLDEQRSTLIDNIFGNINEVYECALHLLDLSDEVMQSLMNNKNEPYEQTQVQTITIGAQFWELGEGNEFEVYSKYIETVTSSAIVSYSLKTILNNKESNEYLKNVSSGLVEISKYLLPKLLLGPIHHLLYIYETVDYLFRMAVIEEDKSYLRDTLDTLRPIKLELKEKGFLSSKKRPLETSFRLFQQHQFQQLTEYEKAFLGVENDCNLLNTSLSNDSSSINTTSTQSKEFKSNSNLNRTPVLASNIVALTEKKWRELETNVVSLKLSNQFLNHENNLSLQSANNLNVSSSNLSMSGIVRYPYLHEGHVIVCKTNQPIPVNTMNASSVRSFLSSKHKLSKRYAYLFDDQIILLKKQQSNMSLTSTSSKKIFKFKQKITLDKCHLKDHEDEHCFELQVFNNQYALNTKISMNNNMEHEYIIIITDSSKEKYQWMSMLCYAQYKFTIDRLLQTITEQQNKNNPLPIPPDNYIFDQPDSPETIIFDLPNQDEYEEQNPYLSSDGLAIKAATLVKLIERLTHHLYLLPKFSHTFLMFFREFCSTKELLSLLSQRFDVPDLNMALLESKYDFNRGEITERELVKRYRREYQQPIRLKVVNVLKHWICGFYFEDFSNDQELLDDLSKFIDKVGRVNKSFEQILKKAIQKKLNTTRKTSNVESKLDQCITLNARLTPFDSCDNLKSVFKSINSSLSSSSSSYKSNSSRSSSISTNEDVPLLNESNADAISTQMSTHHEIASEQMLNDDMPSFETHLESSFPYDLLTIHPLEFARQATLMESELFRMIKPNELISGGWNKPELKHKLSPNITNLINLSNKFIYWYAKCIVDTGNLEERIAVVQRILEIATYFYQMNNFSGLKEIYAAFETSSVARLRFTREKSNLEQHEMYQKFKSLFDDHDKGYMERLKKCSPPCVPFIGTHLTNIYRKNEYNKLNVEKQKLQIKEQQKKHIKLMASSNMLANSNSNVTANSDSTSTLANDETENLINFSKYRLLVDFINDVLQYQNAPYKYRVHEKIRAFLLEDLENYFETAQQTLQSCTNSNEALDTSEHLPSMIDMAPNNPAQLVETCLFQKSKLIESIPYNPMNHKFPRTRNYSLKIPAPSFKPNTKPAVSSNTSELNSKLTNEKRAHSATRLEKNKNVSQSSNLASKATSSAITVDDTSTKSEHKRSNSSTASHLKQIKNEINLKINVTNETLSSSSSSSLSPSPLLTTSQTQTKTSNPPKSYSITNMQSKLNEPSPSPSPTFSIISNDTLNTYLAQMNANLIGNAALSYNPNSHLNDKLSISDSSSSVPNSPPPNYDEVFDTNVFLSSGLSMNKYSFDNKTYFNKPNTPNSLIHTSEKDSNVFAFPDLKSQKLKMNEPTDRFVQSAQPIGMSFTQSTSSMNKINSKSNMIGAALPGPPPPPPPIHPPPPPPPASSLLLSSSSLSVSSALSTSESNQTYVNSEIVVNSKEAPTTIPPPLPPRPPKKKH